MLQRPRQYANDVASAAAALLLQLLVMIPEMSIASIAFLGPKGQLLVSDSTRHSRFVISSWTILSEA
jgi:hypothetical protein